MPPLCVAFRILSNPSSQCALLHTPPLHPCAPAEALSRLTALESAYLSRNPLAPHSLSRLSPLPRLQLLSLINCWFERPPPQLSALRSLRVRSLLPLHPVPATVLPCPITCPTLSCTRTCACTCAR